MRNHRKTFLDNEIVILGGETGRFYPGMTAVTLCESYDTVARSWKQLQNMQLPLQLVGLACVAAWK